MSSTAESPNLGVAFGLVIGAGLATGVGAAVVFFPSLIKLASRRTLAGALGLSAGVMTYVSFIEIFAKSVVSFGNAGHDDNLAYIFATVCFFGGVVAMVILNYLVTCLLGGHHHHHDHPHDRDSKRTRSVSRTTEAGMAGGAGEEDNGGGASAGGADDDSQQMAPCACCAEDPAADLRKYQAMADEIEQFEEYENREWTGRTRPTQAEEERKQEEEAKADRDRGSDTKEAKAQEEEQPDAEAEAAAAEAADSEAEQEEVRSEQTDEDDEDARQERENRKLVRMSINTAVAIGLHNFPEGLATFVAALADPAVGVVLAIAIAIHNVPEGLCVAMPIYYATGQKWKAFWWAILSGAAEPVAALLGWAVLANSFNDTVYAVMFGLVAGMMVIISMKELLPTGHRYDPEDTVVTYFFMLGMVIMAVSLVLFVI